MARCHIGLKNLFMKNILCLLGLVGVIATTGCAYHDDHDHDRHHHGGAYDHTYRGYGHDRYDSNGNYRYDRNDYPYRK